MVRVKVLVIVLDVNDNVSEVGITFVINIVLENFFFGIIIVFISVYD